MHNLTILCKLRDTQTHHLMTELFIIAKAKYQKFSYYIYI